MHPIRRSSRRAQALVIVAVFAAVLVGIGGLVLDLGLAYQIRARMQMACDAAALAASYKVTEGLDAVRTAARTWTQYNGFTHGQDGCVVDVYKGPITCTVNMTVPFGALFSRVLGTTMFPIAAKATAQCVTLAPIPVAGMGAYGVAGSVYLGIVGPYGQTATGDGYSTRWKTNGQPNPNYDPNGYNYEVVIPTDYATKNGTSVVNLDIYDAGYSSSGTVDESNSYATGHPPPSETVTTEYRLYAPDSTPNDLSDDVLIATATYSGNTTATKLKWVTPTGFSFDSSAYPAGKFRLNIRTTNGDSVNTFNLRAGPPGYNYASPVAGTTAAVMQATGHICVEFVSSGTGDIGLGEVPSTVAGGKVHINKFDTDQGATTVTYFYSPDGTWANKTISWAGNLSSNDKWKEDVITMPADFPGGMIKAHYTTGSYDTTNWQMFYEGQVPGRAGTAHLIE